MSTNNISQNSPIPEFKQFCIAFDFRKCQSTFNSITTPQKAINYQGPTLSELCLKYKTSNVRIFIQGWFYILNDLFNFDIDKKLNNTQIEFLANKVIVAFPELKLSDIYLIFNRIIVSHYDYFKYGIDTIKVLKCFSNYSHERINSINKQSIETSFPMHKKATFILKGVLENCTNSSLKFLTSN